MVATTRVPIARAPLEKSDIHSKRITAAAAVPWHRCTYFVCQSVWWRMIGIFWGETLNHQRIKSFQNNCIEKNLIGIFTRPPMEHGQEQNDAHDTSG